MTCITGAKRRFERYQYALKVLERPMNFTGNDTFNLDRGPGRKMKPS